MPTNPALGCCSDDFFNTCLKTDGFALPSEVFSLLLIGAEPIHRWSLQNFEAALHGWLFFDLDLAGNLRKISRHCVWRVF